MHRGDNVDVHITQMSATFYLWHWLKNIVDSLGEPIIHLFLEMVNNAERIMDVYQ